MDRRTATPASPLVRCVTPMDVDAVPNLEALDGDLCVGDAEVGEKRPADARGCLRRWLPLMVIALSSVGFSLQAFCAKQLTTMGVGTFEIIALRGVFQMAGCVAVLSWNMRPSDWFGTSRRTVAFLILRGVVGFAAIAFGWLSIAALPLSESQVLGQTVPIFSGVYAWVILGERWHLSEAFSAFLAVAGVVIVTRPPALFGGWEAWSEEDSEHGGRLFGVVTAIVSAAFGGFVFVLIRLLGKCEVHFATVMLYQAVGQAFIGALCGFLTGQGFVGMWGEKAPYMLVCGCLGFAGQAMMTWGIQREKAAIASIMVKSVAPITAFALQIVFFPDQPVPWTTAVGSIVIFAALVVATVGKLRQDKAASAQPPPSGYAKLGDK